MRRWATGSALAMLAMGARGQTLDPKLYPPAPPVAEGSFNQNPQGGALKGRTLRLKRGLVIVSDLARSIAFYRDVIGLELYSVEPYFDRNPASLGYEMFGIPAGARKRMAMFNTSAELRGLTLQEVRDTRVAFRDRPRAFTLLFETDDVIGIHDRAVAAGAKIVRPASGEVAATALAPRLRFMEMAVFDPDGHVISFFQYFDSDAEWARALALEVKLRPKIQPLR
jgi:catechol 2,3-dioxygenase-like lactoylglutathione lyase family enzyme